MEWVNAIVPLVPVILTEVKQHLLYPFNLSSNISSLETATANLRALKQDVKTEITNAARRNGVPTNQVEMWLGHVEAIEQKTEEISEKYRQLCRCMWNISPNLWSNYKISRNAAKEYAEAKSLHDEKDKIPVIIYMPAPLAQEMPASSSKSPILESALSDIRNDANNIIGIWGMGGVGKTHLLHQINNELSKDGTFVVVFVTCSRECSEEKVQNEIIDKLNLSKTDNVEQKKITIYSFLNQRNFVLLLDDLWSRVDLETIGIPNPMDTIGTCKRKVVLTTRSTEIFGEMEVRKKIKVNVLEWDDAWSLFKEKVTKETINSDPLIQKYAVNVAKELDGLPLALITIGRAMYDKRDPREWEHAFELVKKARLIDVEILSTNSVFHRLKLSYESLKTDILKQCFLHCSLWPEDYHIVKSDLVHLWMGLGLIDEPNINDAYNVGYNYIGRLQAVCLLETSDDKDYEVKMHDVIRDMALWIANNQGNEEKWYVQAGIIHKFYHIKIPPHTEKLSLMNSSTEMLFLSTTGCSTKLSTLLLHNNNLCDSKSLQLETFSELTFLNLSCNNFAVFPVEICKLIKLQFLNFSSRVFREMEISMSKELAALINLKYLFLNHTNCTIPNGVLSELKALRVLDIRNGYETGNEKDLRSFTSLEEELQFLPHFQALGISIINMHDFQMLSQTSSVPIRWLEIMFLEEEQEICLSFDSYFLGNSQLQNNLVSLILSDMHLIEWVKFERESCEQSIGPLRRLEKLSFESIGMKEVVWMGLDPKDIFSRLQDLRFIFCMQLTSISWVACLPCIRVLIVRWCRGLKQLISIDELNNGRLMTHEPSFPSLKIMDLYFNDELESIIYSKITFSALEIFEVGYCDKLRKLPFKTNNPPKKLRLEGSKEWWDNIDMDDVTHRSLLQPFYIQT